MGDRGFNLSRKKVLMTEKTKLDPLQLDKEHERLLEEARKHPGVKEQEALYRAGRRWEEVPHLRFPPAPKRKTVLSPDTTNPDPWA